MSNPPRSASAKTPLRAPLPPALPDTVVPTVSSDADTLDFASAFTEPLSQTGPLPSRPAESVAADTSNIFTVPSTIVRVMLVQDTREQRMSLPEGWNLYAPGVRYSGGRAAQADVKAASNGIRISLDRGAARQVALPCTLVCADAQARFGLGSRSYRGAIVLTAGLSGTLCVLNVLDIEQYLRGVVPEEIGRRGIADAEAVKAQAVAARTYTYRKMLDRAMDRFDLVATVADQVYGGAGAEDSLCSEAIRLTTGTVLTYGNQLVVAYYHSTCGGMTADPSQVWGKTPAPYLVPVSDIGDAGSAWCSMSRFANWTVSWSAQRLEEILTRYAPTASCEGAFAGKITGIAAESRFRCGRAARVRVSGSGGTVVLCADRARFALRRDERDMPILPSVRISSAQLKDGKVVISGSGNGHGVGMCQMGAIGRARAGHTYQQILSAYYTGAVLKQAAFRSP